MNHKVLIFGGLLFCFLGGIYGLSMMHQKPIQAVSNASFLEYCKKAAGDPEIFRSFKRHPLYTIFQENITYEEGKAALGLLQTHSSELLNDTLLERVREVDRVGGAIVYTYDPYGPFSPTTLQHLKIAADLKRHFGELKHLNVTEIGGGSGSLCKVMHEVFEIESYTIIDTPEQTQLTKKHLNSLGIHHVQFVPPNRVQHKQCDLLLSNYAFSESHAVFQKDYMKKLFRGADRGYLVCNFLPKRFKTGSLKKDRVLKRAREICTGVCVIPEEPQKARSSFIMLWGFS